MLLCLCLSQITPLLVFPLVMDDKANCLSVVFSISPWNLGVFLMWRALPSSPHLTQVSVCIRWFLFSLSGLRLGSSSTDFPVYCERVGGIRTVPHFPLTSGTAQSGTGSGAQLPDE